MSVTNRTNSIAAAMKQCDLERLAMDVGAKKCIPWMNVVVGRCGADKSRYIGKSHADTNLPYAIVRDNDESD